ncbi:2Fe-2S iron-sulfur cluster-binding protein [Belliella kenyensis]|uniref:2Fe-2S iron-sulfur cluster-binding protein n=1 Tax=Belliella kenyensis TaxID=1472724 RepID=A0ABV8EGZ5_9BACT|nr:2Fe-2S iron-sulfur cluster-binding protein [Belliella kenyensis]MCH7403718.1 (2Fe-2S)-binding protein [Belliella kenyensis]MDN3603484.1 2Fe-2S iron-sulfur cluster-binding protein [Belliella kenyensis]
MLKIIIENLYSREIKTLETDCKVIELIHENYIDWMHACGKKGRCTSCKMIVVEGMENLSELTEREIFYRENGRLTSKERLTCQAELKSGTIKIRVADVNKFPHVDYGEG